MPPNQGARWRRRMASALLALALMGAACGGSEGESNGDQPVGTDEPAPVVTSDPGENGSAVSPDNTTAPTNGVSGITEGDGPGDGAGEAPGDGTAPDPDSTEAGDGTVPDPPTPIPTPTPGPTEPLTGEPLVDPSIMNRPALAVKIGTSSVGRPQTGINQADVLIEVRVETITRLFAIFHSQDAVSLGPVRSARSSDPDILANFGQPVYGHSGGNPGVLREISQGESAGMLYELLWDGLPNDYWRIADRVPPWNLYTTTANIWRAAPSSLPAPPPLFEYLREGEALPSDAEPVPGVEVRYLGGTVAQFVWDAEAGGWARWQDGTPHVDMARHSDGTPNPNVEPEQVTTANVVVLQTRYTGSAACSYCPEAITVDPEGGTALVFTAGHMIRGRWSRPSASEPWKVTDNNGNPVRLSPGQTFIALPGGDVLVMVQDFAEHLLRNR